MVRRNLSPRIDSDLDEQAREAIRIFRSMQASLSGLASALAGKSLPVVLDTSGVSERASRTDGRVIYYTPPIALGRRTPHERRLCDRRDANGRLRCSACAIREKIQADIYHEIAHNAYGTFDEPSQDDITRAIDAAVAERGTKYMQLIKETVDRSTQQGNLSMMGLGQLISPYLPPMINALEDARVDESMYRARVGTRVMFRADYVEIFENGIQTAEGLTLWRDAPLQSQITIGLFCIGAGLPYRDYLCKEAIEVLDDTEIHDLTRDIATSESSAETFAVALKVLARLRELGYFKSEQDPEDEEEQPQPEPEPEEEEQDEEPEESGDSDEADESDEGESPDSDDTSAEPVLDDEDESGRPEEDSPPEDPESSEDADDDGDPESSDGTSEGGDDPSDGDGGDDSSDSDAEDESGDSSSDDDSDQSEDEGEPGAGSGFGFGPGSGESEGEASEVPGEADSDGGSESELDPGESSDGVDGEDSDPEGEDSPAEPLDDDSGEPVPEDEDSSEADGDHSEPGEESNSGSEPTASDESDGGELSDDGDESEPEQASGSSDDHGGSEESEGSEDAGDDRDESDVQHDDSQGDEPVDRPGNERSDDSDDHDDGDQVGEEAEGAGGDRESDHPDSGAGEASSEGSDGQDSGEPQGGEDGGSTSAYGGGGTDLELEEAEEASETSESAPPLGSLEDVLDALQQFSGHALSGPSEDEEAAEGGAFGDTQETEAEQTAIKIAAVQAMFFDESSGIVTGVTESRYGDGFRQVSSSESAWGSAGSSARTDPREYEVPESVLGKALMEMRRVFTDNARANHQKHLKSGKINQRTLGKRAWNQDPRLFQKKRLPGKRSYSVLIGIDISGSTVGYNLHLAKRAAFAQAELCHRLGIEFAIYAHTARAQMYGDAPRTFLMDIYEVKSFDEPWTTRQEHALQSLQDCYNNLDGHTIEYYRKKLETRNTTDRMLLYYTDGHMPASNKVEETEILVREIQVCKQKNITLVGVGIKTDSPTKYGLDTVKVDTDDDLIQVVKHLEKAILHNR